MKKIILIFLLTLFTFAQEQNQGQSIELPDFVITGKQTITLPTMKKAKPDLIPVLSRDFYFPSFSPEDFALSGVSMPERQMANVLPDVQGYDAQLILGAGQYVLPKGEFHFGKSFESGQIYSKLWGSNKTDYVDYANYNESGIKLGSQFFINRHAAAFPGLGIGIDGYFVRNKYNFYGSRFPSRKRETQRGGVELSFVNHYGDILKYGLDLSGDYLDIKDFAVKELSYSADLFLRVPQEKFIINLESSFEQNKRDEPFITNSFNNYSAEGTLEFRITPGIYAKIGAGYFAYNRSGNSNDDFFGGNGEIGIKLSEGLSLVARYNPSAELLTLSDFIEENPYIILGTPTEDDLDTQPAIFEKQNNNIEAVLSYAYDKYYEINIGGGYKEIDNFHTFIDRSFSIPGATGEFSVIPIDDVTSYNLFINALYHMGPFGWFYGGAEYKKVEDNSGKIIPYQPRLAFNASYGYEFSFGLTSEIGVEYFMKTYADLQNTTRLEDYFNLNAEFRYSLTENLDLTLKLNNLLNRDNYIWFGYIERPFDFVGGIDYRF